MDSQRQLDSKAQMLLGVIAALAFGATLSLSAWFYQRIEGTAIAAGNPPKARAALRVRGRQPFAAERPQPSDRRIGSLILSYSLLRSGTTP